MGEAELKAALLQEAERQVHAAWRDAEKVVADRQRKVDAELRRLTEQAEERLRMEVAALRRSILLRARQRSRAGALQEARQLSQRLFDLACQVLPGLEKEGGERLFRALAAELPQFEWGEVRVGPVSREWVERLFPEARIVVDEGFAGGMLASDASGRVEVDNTLRGRLLRAWPGLLPALLAELETGKDEDATAGPEHSS